MKGLLPLKRLCIPGSTANFGESEQHAPHLTLVSQAIFANGLQLRVPELGSVMDKRHEQRQAHAQWPGITYKRALSKAVYHVSISIQFK